MKPQKTRDVLKFLKSIDWVFIRDGKGSHELWGLADESVKAAIPTGHREVSAYVLSKIEEETRKHGHDLPRNWK